MEWAGWAVAAVLGAVAFMRTAPRSRPSNSLGGLCKYPNKDRGGMAFVVKDEQGDYKVAGGPKNHVAQSTEKITWSVINASDKDVTVEFEFKPSATPKAPKSPFKEGNGPHYVTVAAKPGKVETLTLKVVDKSEFPADTESAYEYSIRLKGIANSEMDPELDIWP